ncbi:MAG: hypothetical protein ACRD3E_09825 [Terriglobales bacterium]
MISTKDNRFLAKVRSWIQSQGEVFATIRFSRAAGSKSFEFFTSFDAFSERLQELPQQTAVTVFRERQLPLRGVVDDAFIRECLNKIPDGAEFLVVETQQRTAGGQSWFHHTAGETHAELSNGVEDSRDRFVAVGVYPVLDCGTADKVNALVPDQNGVLSPGCY